MQTIDKDGATILENNGEKNTRISYENSLTGRAALTAEQPPEIVAKVMAVWGDTPTVEDTQPELETPTMPSSPTIEQRTAALESAMLAMLGGATNV